MDSETTHRARDTPFRTASRKTASSASVHFLLSLGMFACVGCDDSSVERDSRSEEGRSFFLSNRKSLYVRKKPFFVFMRRV